jgi:organic hydroperoxide reductase OsmC/OhrA
VVCLATSRSRSLYVAEAQSPADVTLPSIEDDRDAAELVRAADLVCPCSNATRGNIEVRLTANGAPVLI